MIKCCVCGREFKPGEYMQGFLRSPDDPEGSWSEPVEIDEGFQDRVARANCKIKRRHYKESNNETTLRAG